MAMLNYQRVAGPLRCCSIVLQDGLAIGRKYASQAIGNTDDKGSDVTTPPLRGRQSTSLSAIFWTLVAPMCSSTSWKALESQLGRSH